MVSRIEVRSKIGDPRTRERTKKLEGLGIHASVDEVVDVYTIDADLNREQLETVAGLLINPVTHEVKINDAFIPRSFNSGVEVGFLPGVTDNIGNTVRGEIHDSLGLELEGQVVYSSQLMLTSHSTDVDPISIGEVFSNPVIQSVHTKNEEQFLRHNGMDVITRRVRITERPRANIVNLLDADDDELMRIGKFGTHEADREIAREDYERELRNNSDNALKLGDFFEMDGRYYEKIRGGTLAMDLTYMKAVKNKSRALGRNLTDVEVEVIGQSWSEHCCHTLFADSIDDIKEGLFKIFIKRATEEVRRKKGSRDLCVSVFKDNAGVIRFDEQNNITVKVETHNSPSALDPFGGAITGIVGVNRDPMGTGLGSKPFLNISGPFCFSSPFDESVYYRDRGLTQRMLSPRQINDGVTEGVRVGGNCSGIPTSHFRNYFHRGYRGKPLVHVGTAGIMPVESAGRPSHEKRARVGNYVVMVGGRVGRDGIHGATFSSESLNTGSPVGAVQIGDAITQKIESDMIIKEARDRGLYTSITDNGAGGLSSSVGEMAKESGGAELWLDKVPLKYPGLPPKHITISESQERMTLAIPKENWEEFSDLARRRGVEATIVGEFNDSGKFSATYHGEVVMDLDLEFLHNGRPERPLTTTFTRKTFEEPNVPQGDLTKALHSMLARENITSLEYIARQFDHEVQGGSVIKPLQGKGRVYGSATITRPVLSSKKGVVFSQGINPDYSEIDTYHMAANAIDSAIRNAVATGANLEDIVLLDNFCWCSSNDKERLGQLKRACQACYDYAIEFETPFVSGKDSMFNDFNGYDEQGNKVKISVPPTLTITALGIMDDVRKAVSIDAKKAGNLVYVLGFTKEELGGSEYFRMLGEQTRGEAFVGNTVPRVDSNINKGIYRAFYSAVEKGLVASCASVELGGLGVALAKTSVGGRLGMEVDLTEVASYCTREDYTLFSESSGRLVVSVNPKFQKEFEATIGRNMCKLVGKIRDDDKFIINGKTGSIDTTVDKLEECYKGTFKDF